MNIDVLLPVISKMIGRDLSKELNLFYRARAAVGASMDHATQVFFINNYPQIVDFMETEEGKKAIAAFIDSWVLSMIPKTVAEDPKEEVKQ